MLELNNKALETVSGGWGWGGTNINISKKSVEQTLLANVTGNMFTLVAISSEQKVYF